MTHGGVYIKHHYRPVPMLLLFGMRQNMIVMTALYENITLRAKMKFMNMVKIR